MGFLSKLRSKANQNQTPLSRELSFVMGVEDIFYLKEGNDLVVTGFLQGKVCTKCAVYVSNLGEDNDSILLTTVMGIETEPGKSTEEAENCHVALRLENAKTHLFKKGTVLYTRDQVTANVHKAYINTLGNVFIGSKKMLLTKEDISMLSITDSAEIWRLFSWMQSQKRDLSKEEQIEDRQKIDILAKALCEKILNANEIYYVHNNLTGEPHLFSSTLKRSDGNYECTPPDILIFTKAYAEVMKRNFAGWQVEIRKIENGEDRKGIYNFFGSTFYLNGACGVKVISEQTAINADMFVPAPDYTNIPAIEIPVTNPNVVRWMLLLGQLDTVKDENRQLKESLYCNFITREFLKARFLIPMKIQGNEPKHNENGEVVLEKDTVINFPMMDGKSGKMAIRMYTDWKRLRMEYDESWSGMIQTIGEVIEKNDCAINATKFPKAGFYIDSEMYEDMRKRNA